MPNPQGDEFQQKISTLLVRNSNVLDILTKCQNSCGKICRSVVKSATGCGCTKITAEKTLSVFAPSETFSPTEISGTEGKLCNICQSRIEDEIGEMLFYTAGLCNALGLDMKGIMKKEIKNMETLGKYSLR